MITYTIFIIIGIIGMCRTESTTHIFIVLRVLVGVSNNETDGSTGCLAFEYSAEKFHLVRFFSRCGDTALPWTTAIELALNEVHVDADTSWHTVNNTTYSFTVAFTKGRQWKYFTKCIHFWLEFISV